MAFETPKSSILISNIDILKAKQQGEIAQMVRRLLRILAIPGSNPVVTMLQRAFDE